METEKLLMENCKKSIKECTKEEIYWALVKTVHNLAQNIEPAGGRKKLYYISAEFLTGKLLCNNLINLGVYDEVKHILENSGFNLSDIEEMEAEPSLGNGGLGRLASCFMDSVATLGLKGDGVGLCYHYGLFRQRFEHNHQSEEPDIWMNNSGFLKETDESFTVDFKDFSVKAKLCALKVVGYKGCVNKLNLFDVEGGNNPLPQKGIDIDFSDVKNNLTSFLYPDDSTEAGKRLRVYQQYFMVSCGAQLIVKECLQAGISLEKLYEFAVVQINDTHPALIIPELVRLLCGKGIYMDDAIEIVRKTCAYTNHTILAEALEKWPVEYIKDVAPGIMPIIEVLDNKIRRKTPDASVYIIDGENRACMAHLAIHYSFSVNGVAELHTNILKEKELKNFYLHYPDKFNNKTNGITFRRWLLKCNPRLTEFICELIGDGFKSDEAELAGLMKFSEDKAVLNKLCEIKQHNKKELKEYISRRTGITINEASLFDMQIKRLHEYKRQQMNALRLISAYLDICEGNKPLVPITAFFGAKAAPAYTIAKDIIHLILCLSRLIEKNPEASRWLKVVMVENYNVTWAERLIPACNVSQQISLASKEASGTGNMKFILNGGVILGTMDGANVEISKLVGEDNIYIFGEGSEQVINRYERGDYNSGEYYESNPRIKRAVDFISGKELSSIGDKKSLERLQRELLNKDWFMTFPDFESYEKAYKKAEMDYTDSEKWAKKMLKNISVSGFFSSDRTVAEYNRDIWKL